MKRFFLLLLTLFIFNSTFSQQCKQCRATCSNCKQDSISVKLINNNAKNTVSIDTASIEEFYKQSNSNDFDRSKWFSLLLTAIGLYFAYFTFNRSARFKNFDFLSEVDKQLMSNPTLWCIYDKKAKKIIQAPKISLDKSSNTIISGIENISFKKNITVNTLSETATVSSNDNFLVDSESVPTRKVILEKGKNIIILPCSDNPLSITVDGEVSLSNCDNLTFQTPNSKEIYDRVEAFCYYKLNNFENVFRNYGLVKFGSPFRSWERYLIEIMLTSTPFNEVVNKAIKRDYLSDSFSVRLIKYQQISNNLKQYHEKFENDEMKKSDYNKLYSKQLNDFFWKEIIISKLMVCLPFVFILFTILYVLFE